MTRLFSARWWRPIVFVAALAAAAWTLRGHLPSPADAWDALRGASPAWLLAAGGLSMLSMAAFAEQQRHLLSAFGVRMTARVSLALTYARSAMAASLPAGSAISAGYAFRQFRARGAGQATAGAVIVLSGVASLAGLALVYMVIEFRWTLWLLAAVALPLARISRPAVDAEMPERAGGRVRHTLRLAAAVPPRRWLGVLAIAALNWLTDLACLLAAMEAVGLHVPWQSAAIGYLVAQLVRQIPATPGGVGVIEAALIVALTTAGAAAAPATAAVLIYRVLSCWSVLPIGLACWSALKSRLAAPVVA
ncbi:lysylphosphatidylglycerol synthase domain-containing protein [Dactylosporangium darangshiense]|uniref:Lysylphosphatidylglycerol synthase domain-containing protein n=1 Tax=Dactylosporangium darangshiense TaxID=579108 RepID=A0ABP8D007_9ACTN